MFQSGIKELINKGYDKMILDCLKLNPTNNFYKHFGGKIIDTATVKMGEQELEENIYLYDNLKFMI
jgi:hypothetical protein